MRIRIQLHKSAVWKKNLRYEEFAVTDPHQYRQLGFCSHFQLNFFLLLGIGIGIGIGMYIFWSMSIQCLWYWQFRTGIMHMTRGWPVSWKLFSTGHPMSSIYSYSSEQAFCNIGIYFYSKIHTLINALSAVFAPTVEDEIFSYYLVQKTSEKIIEIFDKARYSWKKFVLKKRVQ